jgi:hypothetical protein
MYKPSGVTRKTEKRQSGTLAPCDCTTKVFTVRNAIAGFAAQQNQTIKKHLTRKSLGGATIQ